MSDKYGLFKGMDDITYHFERDEISSSGLKLIKEKSPAHYQYAFLDSDHKEKRLQERIDIMTGKNTQKSHLRFGDCFHIMLLEPKHFNEKVILWSGKPRNTKDGRADYESAMEAYRPGMRLMTEDEYQSAQDMAASVMSLKSARNFLERDGDAELSFFWKDEVYDVDCKARMDFVTNDGFIIDVKTAQQADHENFKKGAFNFRYYMQAAF